MKKTGIVLHLVSQYQSHRAWCRDVFSVCLLNFSSLSYFLVYLVWSDFQGLSLPRWSMAWSKIRTKALRWNEGLAWNFQRSFWATFDAWEQRRGGLLQPHRARVFHRRHWLARKRAGSENCFPSSPDVTSGKATSCHLLFCLFVLLTGLFQAPTRMTGSQ